MKYLKKIFLILFFLLTSFTAIADTLSQREVDLYESLLDMAARFDAGVNYRDFKSNLSDLDVKFDRYTRSGGDRYGTLYDAMKAYRDAAGSWEESINVNFASGSKIMLDLAMMQAGYARNALDKYKAEKLEAAKKPQAKGKKSPNSKNESVMEELDKQLKANQDKMKADMETLNKKHKQEIQDIKSKMNCSYTRPPSC